MPKQLLVSIIIPAYNRAHLIGETLDSVIAQTYNNWECLVVDDGSLDDTEDVIAAYVKQDSRIKLFKRPKAKLKGANACRNIGLTETQGDYVVFFDSDDLMTENHLEVKVNAILKFDYDYVITKTKNLNGKNPPDHYYAFDAVEITPYNYISHKINWLTLDIIIKKRIIKGIFFNENLQSGQEYNFYSKLVVRSTNYYFENQFVSLRRHHSDSTRSNIDSKLKLVRSKFLKEIETLKDLRTHLSVDSKVYLLVNAIKIISIHPKFVVGYRMLINSELFKLIGFQFVYFELMILLKKVNKAYRIRNRIIKALVNVH